MPYTNGIVAGFRTLRNVTKTSRSSRSGSAKNTFDCIKAFSGTDFTKDLEKFNIPTLIVHGDDDQIVPIAASAMRSSKIVKGAVLKIYKGGSHSLGDTSKDQLNADLLEFAKS